MVRGNAEELIGGLSGRRGTGGMISSSTSDDGRVALLVDRPRRSRLRDRNPACDCRTLDLRTAERRVERLLPVADDASPWTPSATRSLSVS